MAIPHFGIHAGREPNEFVWQPAEALLTPAQTLQGGAGLGAAITAMEHVTDRPLIWSTAQYLSFALGTEPVDIAVTVEAEGRHTSQARCILSRDDTEILTAHAALGRRRFDEEATWARRPDVPRPEDCEEYRFFDPGRGDLGDLAELRLALGRQLDDIERSGGRGDGSFAIWMRCWSGSQYVSAADLAVIGDFMPLGFADAAGRSLGGNSLDNTIRVGRLDPTEWILLSVHIQQIVNGFGHGHAELWTEDGTLLGAVAQSSIIRSHARLRRQHQSS